MGIVHTKTPKIDIIQRTVLELPHITKTETTQT